MHQNAALFEQFHNGYVSVKNLLAVVFRKTIAHDAGSVHVGGQIELVLHPGVEVVGAVGRRGVDYAGALIHGDVVGEHAQDCAIKERVGELYVLQFLAGEAGENLGLLQSNLAGEFGSQLLGDDVHFAAGFERDVFRIGMKGHCHGRGKRPGRGGPDHGESLFPGERGIKSRRILGQRVLYPDRRAGMVFILHFGFGERSLVEDAPVHRAQAFIDEFLFQKVVERCQHNRLVLRSHGGVGVVPASEDADSFELLALQIEKFLRVLSARFPDLQLFHLKFLTAQLLIDLDLDGQAVTIPSRDVRRVKSGHGFRFDDEILEALVEGMAQVNGAVGVGWTIVQNVGRRPLPGLANALVDSHFLPASQGFRLILGQVSLHGEAGLRQIDGGFQLQRHSVDFSQMIDFFHYRERENERPLTFRASFAKALEDRAWSGRRVPQKHCQKGRGSVYNFAKVPFASAWHLSNRGNVT